MSLPSIAQSTLWICLLLEADIPFYNRKTSLNLFFSLAFDSVRYRRRYSLFETRAAIYN
jgi:hypothetical protein